MDGTDEDDGTNRRRWYAALREVADRHRHAARAAEAGGDAETAGLHLRAAARAEEVAEELGSWRSARG